MNNVKKLIDSGGHFNGLSIFSYNAIFNFINTNRNLGKTWIFKYRAVKRALKRGKKCIWVRTFENEVKECINTFFSSKDLRKFCGLVEYNKKTSPNGNFYRQGNTFYIKRKNKFVWFLKVVRVGSDNAMRSADDVDVDTIVYDEYTTTPQKIRYYNGNLVDNFIDMFISAKREHKVNCYFLGNKENVINLFFNYFNLKNIDLSKEFIKLYKNNSILVCNINNIPKEKNEYDKKLKCLFENTNYGNYLYKSKYKNENKIKCQKTPPQATNYLQLYINNTPIKISHYNGIFYINNNIDTNLQTYVLERQNKFKKEILLINRYKKYLQGFINALSNNDVYYNNLNTYTIIQEFYKWLNI